MKHFGDITKLTGNDLPFVDIITGGSPCQDLSVAGKRAGLAGARSGLFMEQIRLIKEMRGATNGKQPRYMVWENVPGAFSSNKGEDFRCVLEETAKVADERAVIPRYEKWTPSGCIMGDGWSIAWRVHDAQFWGVPQRRKRIALVADFGGDTAPEILFERKGVSGDFEESGEERKGTAADVEKGVGETGGAISFQERAGKPGGGKGILIQNERTGALSTLNNQRVCCLQGSMIGREDKNGPQGDGINEDVSFTLNATDRHAVVYGISSYDSNAMKSSNPHSGIYQAETARTLDLNGGSPACNQGGMAVVYDARGNGDGNTSPTLTGDHQNRITDYTAIAVVGEPIYHSSKNSYHTDFKDDSAADTLVATDYKDPPTVCEGPEYIVRRLTPLECERLQNYPDGYTNIGEWVDSKGKRHKDTDSPRYKALGNSIALPFWQYLANKMVKYLNKPTMGSLFDGISGFCLVFARAGANPIFASEIEEFPIAVAKQHFGDDNSGEVGDYAKYL